MTLYMGTKQYGNAEVNCEETKNLSSQLVETNGYDKMKNKITMKATKNILTNK